MAADSRRRRLWWTAALVAVLVVLAAGGALAFSPRDGSGPGHGAAAAHRHRTGTTRPPGAVPTTVPSTTTTTTAPPATTTTTGPGTLPQTPTLPPASDPQFNAEMQDLWQAVVSDDVTTALPAFFPQGAYVQVKAIGDAAADYEDRIAGELGEDLAAAHALLGADPAAAQLVAVSVPEQYAHWVAPGTCYNAVGYWEVPNSRVVFQSGGAERSFGIASLISWRGQWYVVHLGAVVRPTTTTRGIVDDPATGPGYSAYSSTC